MGVQITVRDVPEAVRDVLAVRAAQRRQSMQEFLRAELERLAARPSMEELMIEVRNRKRAARRKVTAEDILAERDADRR